VRDAIRKTRLVNKYSRGLADQGVAALRLAAAGYPVYRLIPGKGTRLMKEADEAPTSDLEQVAGRWATEAQANIGCKPGLADCVVFDGDNHGEADGVSALHALYEQHSPPEMPIAAHTPRNGTHHWWSIPRGVEVHNFLSTTGRKEDAIPGIDVLKNQNCVMPGSVKGGKAYTWDDDDRTLLHFVPPMIPDSLLALCLKRTSKEFKDSRPPVRVTSIKAYVRAALEKAHKAVAQAPDGRRNDELNRETFGLAGFYAKGYLTEDQIHGAMSAACEENGMLGEPEGPKEFDKTFASGMNRGSECPRPLIEEGRASVPPSDGSPSGSHPESTSSSTSTEESPSTVRDELLGATGYDPGDFDDCPIHLRSQMFGFGDQGRAAMLVWALGKYWYCEPGFRGRHFHLAWAGTHWVDGATAEAHVRNKIYPVLRILTRFLLAEIEQPEDMENKDWEKWKAKERAQVKSIGPQRKAFDLASDLVAKPRRIEASKTRIACANGTIDLRTEEFFEGRWFPGDFLTHCSEATWHGWDADVDELAPSLLPFLRDALKDEETLEVVRMVAGNALSGYGSEYTKKCLVLWGVSNTGKGVITTIMQIAVGDDGWAPIPMSILYRDQGSGANEPLARLEGKRLAVVEDTGDSYQSTVMDSDSFKSLTGGGDSISASVKFGPQRTFRPMATLVLCTNKPPSFSEKSSSAYLNRMVVIRMTNKKTLGEGGTADGDLKDRLREEERDGVFLWCAAAARDFLKRKAWGTSKSTERAKAAMEDDNRTDARRFFDEYLRLTGDELLDVRSTKGREGGIGTLSRKELFWAFQGMAIDENDALDRRWTQARLSRAMNNILRDKALMDVSHGEPLVTMGEKVAYVDISDPAKPQKKARGWEGIGLTAEAYDLMEMAVRRMRETR